MKSLYLCGAGNPEGVRLALTINEKQGRWNQIILLDDDPSKHGKVILDVEVAGPFEMLKQADPNTAEVANLVARTTAGRWSVRRKIEEFGLPFATLIHPNVDITGVILDEGITIYPNAALLAHASVGAGSVIFTGTLVGHGCRLGRGCVVAPGAVINARVEVGDRVYIGTNAAILPDLKIGPRATIGVCSAVVEDVPADATVMGVPAQIMMTRPRKLDHKVLPKQKKGEPHEEKDSEAPGFSTEKTLAELWAEGLRVEKVGKHDNFFDLGGDSILALQIIGKANQLGIQLCVRQLLDYPTIAELAEVATRGEVLQEEQGPATGRVLSTPVQKWLLEQDLPDLHHYNQTMLLKLPKDVDLDQLEAAIGEMFKQHDALRMRFTKTGEGWDQVYDDFDGVIPFSRLDLTNKDPDKQQSALSSAIADFQASLDLTDGPIFRAVYFDLGENCQGRLLLVIHHLVVDGISWRILLEDLQTVYVGLINGEPIKLPAKTTSFQRWTERLSEHAGSTAVLSETGYWLSEDRNLVPPLPRDIPDAPNTEASTRTIITSLTLEETQDLLQKVPAAYNTQINDVLLTALAQALSKWTGESKLLIDLEGHGREEIIQDVNISRTIGWFTSIFPVVTALEPSHTEGDALKSIKEQLHRIPNHGIGYGLLRYLSDDGGLTERLQNLPQAEIQFNYLGQFDQMFTGSSIFEAAPEPPGAFSREASPLQSRPYLLEIQGMVVNDELKMRWLYSGNVHRPSTIEGLADEFMARLRALISHCCAKKVRELTPSAFPLPNRKTAKIQTFVKDDIPQVADLHEKVFRGNDRGSAPSLKTYFEDIFFHNPWYDETFPSLVYKENNGKIVGFLGVFPRPMRMNGKAIKASISTQFMVEPGGRGQIGLMLLETLFTSQQDLLMTDGASHQAKQVWEALGGATCLLYSIHWTRVLRPSQYIIALLRERFPILSPFAIVSKPFGHLIDAIATRFPPTHLRQLTSAEPGEELTEEALLTCLAGVSPRRSLQPQYDHSSLEWLLKIAQTKGQGKLQKVLVRNQERKIIGWYLYFLNPGLISQVVQIGATKETINQILDHLFYHAWNQGVSALTGRLDPIFLQEFSEKHCMLNRDGPWMLMHSRKPEILQAIHRGDAFFSRLEGEWWMRFSEDWLE